MHFYPSAWADQRGLLGVIEGVIKITPSGLVSDY